MRAHTSSTLLACSAAVLAFALAPFPRAAAAKEKPEANHWVATWATTPSAPSPDDQMRRRKMEFDNQTVRLIAHISLGGERFRVRLSNYYGVKAVAIGEVHLASVVENEIARAGLAAPGMSLKHYSPRARVELLDGSAEQTVIALKRRVEELKREGKTFYILAN